MTPKSFGWRMSGRFYTACCGHTMAVIVAGSAAKRVGQTGHAGGYHFIPN